ncbi:1,4-dihydroxy-2-naphthoate polyprenyltransferase [Thioalkalivibrio sp. XN8]|uniref:1,4-dihydroxy-2-naphthoate polyprenyltransferase n=1 Tax=Thioalkalivibrio sp. XN8 TaxID=2712863 RepID=UPI003211F691
MSTATPRLLLQHWLSASRPRTLWVAVVPVLVGTALAAADTGQVAWGVFAVTVLAALLIQVGTNLHNDVADFERGADDPGTRLGPRRATAEGWLPPTAVKRAAVAAFAGAGALGLWLAWIGGWPILAIGVASIVCAWGYSGGARPIAYSSLGEMFVWLFFGLAAVAGSHYLQAGRFDGTALLAGALLGMPAAAVLVVNNYRDRENDARAGRRTVAVVYGARASRLEYATLMTLPFAALPVLAWLQRPGWLWPLLVLPWAALLVRRFVTEPVGPAFNTLLGDTARLQFIYGLLLCVGVYWGGLGD